MIGLGFGSGYIAHGGEIGSFLSRILAVRYDACKAIHLNFCLMTSEPPGINPGGVTASKSKNLSRLDEFVTKGNAIRQRARHEMWDDRIRTISEPARAALLDRRKVHRMDGRHAQRAGHSGLGNAVLAYGDVRAVYLPVH